MVIKKSKRYSIMKMLLSLLYPFLMAVCIRKPTVFKNSIIAWLSVLKTPISTFFTWSIHLLYTRSTFNMQKHILIF